MNYTSFECIFSDETQMLLYAYIKDNLYIYFHELNLCHKFQLLVHIIPLISDI